MFDRRLAPAAVMVAVLLSACTASTTIDTTSVSVPTTSAVPTASAVPTTGPAPPTAMPTSAPTPTGVVPPTPTALPTAIPRPTATPRPTEPPEPQLFQEVLEGLRESFDLPATGPDYDDLVDVTDDSGSVFATAPAAWTDVDGRPWVDDDDQEIGNALTVSTDVDAWRSGWGEPGVFIGASAELGFASLDSFLDDRTYDQDCERLERRDYFDGLYSGRADLYVDCGTEGSFFAQIAAVPEDESFLVSVQLLAPTEQDLDAVIIVVETFLADPGAGFGFDDLVDEIRRLAALPAGGGPYDYVEVSDDTGRIVVQAPSAWTDVYGGPYDDDVLESTGAGLSISTDIAAFGDGFDTPGVFIGTLDESPYDTPEELIEQLRFDDVCTYEGERPYDDGLYVGVIDIHTDCEAAGSVLLTLAVAPADGSYLILGDMVATTERDLEALITALETFIAEPPAAA